MTYLHMIDGNKAVLANYARDLLYNKLRRNPLEYDFDLKLSQRFTSYR